ncbi:MAG: hypothetical protein COB62_01145 [Piscirickettsiaceae bacterium]|nr:MAG: hypothetical protein COB62_01145 [Piscirickettsiaceae bacterium]
MSHKPTPTQINYLQWIKEGHSIHFCTEVSNQLGEMVYSMPPPFKTNHRAILNLLRDGYLNLTEKYFYGIRWAILSINPMGLDFLENIHG